MRPTRLRSGTILGLILWASPPTFAHDIPNARVDRSIQVIVEPGRIKVDYEVSIGELTLIQELRQLDGELPELDRTGLFAAYGRETGPLNAKGVLISVDGEDVDLKAVGFDLAIEGHPRYTFHFEAILPERGRLRVNDINFASSEGTSRLAIRGAGGVVIRGDSLPVDVAGIPIRPVWQLSNLEERRTRQVTVEYATGIALATVPTRQTPSVTASAAASSGLSRLLDDVTSRGWPALFGLAFLLGAGHAIQPGHGKTLVASASIASRSNPTRGAILGLVTAAAHLSSVAVVALVVWSTRTSRFESFHMILTRSSGFAIAAMGCWRLGRTWADYVEPDEFDDLVAPQRISNLLMMGLAGGIVPCWDAVALVVLSEAVGKVKLGLALLVAFSLGMAAVLVLVGTLAGRFRSGLQGSERFEGWQRRVSMAGGLILTGIGVSLLFGR